ncbi:UDP-2,3-diacylglucosamine hydrolase [Thiosulfatimonas sediminis]|uniref:UDP-2,3-diacylglucosamine hydrolase n=1 Tax=Thiosulfatimonas sediminis TaxID=2675054 RepID=A0A6F8PUT4_9GAMM|nr:UDP-2,3-diacylglucosamine diphosphatase [Thiosulfatimonas sediminis]BBP45740.1 UDP-2,3-diacylglucosamine hydrolase [Thiosulfatimonas sediminis]
MNTLVIADIHLQPNQPEHPINQTFQRFLREATMNVQRLIILGDLFEVWLGDDLSLTQYTTEIALLKSLEQQGCEILVQYGNRDFLMRTAFFQASGANLIGDEYILPFAQQQILMVHGDQLCSADTAYQKMRAWLRNPLIQWLFLHLSKAMRNKIGAKMRNQSQHAGRQKNAQMMDVTTEAINDLLDRHPQAKILIHGHTHKPHYQRRQIKGKAIHHYVLSDWRPQTQYLKITDTEIQILKFA